MICTVGRCSLLTAFLLRFLCYLSCLCPATSEADETVGVAFLQVGFADGEPEQEEASAPDGVVSMLDAIGNSPFAPLFLASGPKKADESVTGKCFTQRKNINSIFASCGLLTCSSTTCPMRPPVHSLTFSEFGMFNPSLVRLPQSWVTVRQSFPTAAYAVTVRRDTDQCSVHLMQSSVLHTLGNIIGAQSESEVVPQFLLLDSNFCVVFQQPFFFSNGRDYGTDIRLLMHDDHLYITYNTHQSYGTRERTSAAETRESVAPLSFRADASSANQLSFYIDAAHEVPLGGIGDKNIGLFSTGSNLSALFWLNVVDDSGVENHKGKVNHTVTSWNRGTWHNSAHLLHLADGSGDLLGMMHIHRDKGRDKGTGEYVSDFLQGAALFGTNYTQRFFRMQGSPPHNVIAMTDEFCIPDDAGDCESIQMVMSMVREGEDDLIVSFGSNDCVSNLAMVKLSSVVERLAPLPSAVTTQIREVSFNNPKTA